MSDNRRIQRIEKEVREVLASYLLTGFRGTLRGLVTLTRVKVSGDMRVGKLYISVLGSKEDEAHSLSEIEARLFEMQKELAVKLKMRNTPKLSVEIDRGIERSLKIDAILREMNNPKDSGSDGASGSS